MYLLHSVNIDAFRLSKTDKKYYRDFLQYSAKIRMLSESLRTESSYLGLDLQEKSEIL